MGTYNNSTLDKYSLPLIKNFLDKTHTFGYKTKVSYLPINDADEELSGSSNEVSSLFPSYTITLSYLQDVWSSKAKDSHVKRITEF